MKMDWGTIILGAIMILGELLDDDEDEQRLCHLGIPY